MPFNDSYHKLCRNFSRAAATYDRFAAVQAQTAKELAAMLADYPRHGRRILEIGCGTGTLTSLLRQRYPQAVIDGVDFSSAMLLEARRRDLAGVRYHCCEAEAFLAGCNHRFSLIISNATWQWLLHPAYAFAQAGRLLEPQGLLLLSVFGPRSLEELGKGMTYVLGKKYTLPAAAFPAYHAYRTMLAPVFGQVAGRRESYRQRYDSVLALLRQISRTGTAGVGPVPVLNRRRLNALEQWFVATYGGCLATSEIYYFGCRK